MRHPSGVSLKMRDSPPGGNSRRYGKRKQPLSSLGHNVPSEQLWPEGTWVGPCSTDDTSF